MCGIVGTIGVHDAINKNFLSSIAHRGPDSSGYFSEGSLFLGHTRLSILDLSENGNQPMYSGDGRYVIVFNGEIYNHREIRKSLSEKYSFKSTSDTETILCAYIEYGVSFLNDLNGIFALAIYDRTENEIFIARDQLGVKPLYIYQDESCFLFSSEIKSFLNIEIDKTLSVKAFSNYLTFLWSPGELTPFEKVKKLLPGHYLHFKLNDYQTAKAQRFYQIPFKGQYLALSEEELVNELEQHLIKAVEKQLLSDAPVGFFLSGGLDSSLLVALARKLRPEEKLQCYTIETSYDTANEGFEDDLHYARKVAEHLNVDLHVVKADVDILRDFDKMIWHLDEPQSDASPLNVFNICALARRHGIKVLIGGTGGDDLFSGYRRHKAIALEKQINLLPSVLRGFLGAAGELLPARKPFFRRLRKFSRELGKEKYERLSGYFGWLSQNKVKDLFNDKWKLKLGTYNSLSNLVALNQEIREEGNLLNQVLFWEMRSFLVDQNLNYTDKLSMAVGIEARVPYLDLDLVNFTTKIPPEMKMKGSETKYILKKVAEKYLPKEVIYRAKTGFGAPVRKWIIEDLDRLIQDYLSPDQIKQRGIFCSDKVWQLIEDNKKGKIDASYSVWSLLAIESWMRQFHDKKQ